jgi:hypothetical protein
MGSNYTEALLLLLLMVLLRLLLLLVLLLATAALYCASSCNNIAGEIAAIAVATSDRMCRDSR